MHSCSSRHCNALGWPMAFSRWQLIEINMALSRS
jgi:hypothetical protein